MDGNTDIYVHDLVSGKSSSLPLPKGVNGLAGKSSAFTKDGSKMLYYHNGPTAAGDLWVVSTSDKRNTQLTHSMLAVNLYC